MSDYFSFNYVGLWQLWLLLISVLRRVGDYPPVGSFIITLLNYYTTTMNTNHNIIGCKTSRYITPSILFHKGKKK